MPERSIGAVSKTVVPLAGTEGSNPSLSARPAFLLVPPRRTSSYGNPLIRHIALLLVSRYMLLSHHKWGNEVGKGKPIPLSSLDTGSLICDGADRQAHSG